MSLCPSAPAWSFSLLQHRKSQEWSNPQESFKAKELELGKVSTKERHPWALQKRAHGSGEPPQGHTATQLHGLECGVGFSPRLRAPAARYFPESANPEVPREALGSKNRCIRKSRKEKRT